MKVIAYLRVSTERQGENGYGIDAQRDAITKAATARDWDVTFITDTASGKNTNRAGLTEALATLKSHKADALVVAKLDRVSRSLKDLAGLLERSEREHWAFIALDLGVDTTTPAGELMANIMGAVSRWERRVIGQRTREGLQAARERGVKLGSGVLIPAEVQDRLIAWRASGLSYAAVAHSANVAGIPCYGKKQGGKWYASTVRAVCLRADDQSGCHSAVRDPEV